jgi:hypothetical protein
MFTLFSLGKIIGEGCLQNLSDHFLRIGSVFHDLAGFCGLFSLKRMILHAMILLVLV